jgi:hypothetical protein
MLRIAGIVAALATAVLPYAAPGAAEAPPRPVDEAAAKGQAIEAGKSWLALVDAKKYAESWDQASSLFQKKITRDQWVSMIGGARGGVGKLQGRKFASASYTSLDGVPTVVLAWDSSFGAASGLTEQVTMMLDGGRWRCSGYFIRPG